VFRSFVCFGECARQGTRSGGAMKFATFSVMDYHPSMGRSVPALYQEALVQIEFAEALGFHSVWFAEHHFSPYGCCPAPLVLLAAAAQRSKRLRLGVAVSVLPFHNPLEIAEQYAMVDILSAGRLELGVGRGYLAHEYEGFRVPREESAGRFEEALTILEKAWSGETFTFEGKFFQYGPLALNVLPVQQPRPPMWIAGLSPETYARAPLRGYPIMGVPYTLPHIESLEPLLQGFLRAAQESGLQPDVLEPAMAFHIYVGETDTLAQREAQEYIQRYVETRAVGNSKGFAELQDKGLIIVGGPDRCIRMIQRLEHWGVRRFLAVVNFGGLPPGLVLQSMERLAREVMPAFAEGKG
jgi:alkanesulfonate monooxygenase SsuD/methylene tetrahydromethanopterin reductase-like flavin-dependent oxidoreductase (luciferase family)